MKKLKKIVVCVLPIIMLLMSIVNVYAYPIDKVKDFKPKSDIEKKGGHYAHTKTGDWNNGSFFETVTWAVTGYDSETGKQKVRIRYYITHRGGTGSYIYQKVPVAIDVDGKKIATFSSNVGEKHKVSNTTALWGEKTIQLKPGSHTIELYDDKEGAITVVNVTFKFNVPKPTFTVNFLGSDGTVLKTETVIQGENATPPTPPVIPGYTFDKWDKDYTNIKSDKDITAIYKINKYTVTWKDYNGKTLKEEIVNYGNNASPPPSPSRPGYTFTGWDKGYTNITSNRVITAQYNINKYTVTWKDYNGTVLKSEIVNHGSNATPPASPSRPGYTFTGWDSTYTNITSNRVITATYSINYYGAITSHWVSKDTTPGAWNPPGNTNANGSMILYTQSNKQSLSYGSMYYPKPVEIEGYELSSNDFGYNAPSGWTSKPNGTGVQVLQYVGAEYYYKKKVYTVTFVTNGGSNVPTQKILYKNKATFPSPTKENNKFMGWYADKEFKMKFDPNTQITGNTTVYARWDEKPTITAENMVIFEDLYTEDQWKKERKENATAKDKEDGDITDKIQVIYDNTNLSKKGEYKVTYKVSDSVGNTTTKDIKVTVVDKTVSEEKTNKYIRSISSKYLDTLKPTSKWRLQSDLSSALRSSLLNSQTEETWILNSETIERIKQFNRSHDYSPESNALFLSQFGNFKY